MLYFVCTSFDSFFDAMAKLEQTTEFQELSMRQKDVVCNMIGEWFELAYDDLVYRIYGFPPDSGFEPEAYLELAKKRGDYRQMTYEYRVVYPDFGELVAVFTF